MGRIGPQEHVNHFRTRAGILARQGHYLRPRVRDGFRMVADERFGYVGGQRIVALDGKGSKQRAPLVREFGARRGFVGMALHSIHHGRPVRSLDILADCIVDKFRKTHQLQTPGVFHDDSCW
eukprot:scaffold1320_cov166-Chaetoceros_neogracile.AAC.3